MSAGLLPRLAGRPAAWWAVRAARERRILAAGAIVVVPMLVVFGLVLPAGERIAKLEARSLTLARQLAELRDMQAWLTARSAPSDANALAGVNEAAARLAVELAALPGVRANASAVDGGVEVSVEAAGFDLLLAWLDRVQKRERLFPAEVRLSALPEAGLVGGRLRLARAAS